MTKWMFAAAMSLAASAACSGTGAPVSTATLASGMSALARAQTIRIELPLVPDVPDVARLMVRDALRALGYTVEVVTYSDNVIAMQAMLNGTLDLARVPLPQALGAIQQGAAVSMIVGGGDHTRILATAPGIKTCSDLNHQQVAVPNLISVQTLLLKRYVATTCPGTTIEPVVIAGVENRLAALLAGRTGGALLESAHMFELQRLEGSKFHVLSDLAVEFPGLNGAAVLAPRAFIERYPGTVRDIVRETVLATRRIHEPAALKQALEQLVGFPADKAERTAKLYLERKAFDVNGGLTDDVLQTSIDFYVEAGVLKPGLTPAQITDRSHLTAVLNEIGWK